MDNSRVVKEIEHQWKAEQNQLKFTWKTLLNAKYTMAANDGERCM